MKLETAQMLQKDHLQHFKEHRSAISMKRSSKTHKKL